ncbi:MAG: hypothetical protein NZM31_00340 [Gemmatales bacterium]|nr:hypothetical protein [Gemmatales bacterium]MDW8385441.1 hypothetical protein [Gemmatales bacterium]
MKTLRGVIRGKAIELSEDPGLREGEQVLVTVSPLPSGPSAAGEGLRRSAGAWAAEADEVDRFLAWNAEQRRADRQVSEL